jgi:demethylmenaquinone methyltransferase/2-methoxy-6-polyprenyl-1,4-benzoquinol methylase
MMNKPTQNGVRTPRTRSTLARRVLEGQSAPGNRFFRRLLEWLDSPTRLKHTDRERLLRGSGTLAGQTVLEVGCGSGFFTVPAAQLVGEVGTLYSTDIQPLAVEMTARKVREAGLANVIVRKEDALHSSFEGGTFDTVVVFGVLPAPFLPTKDLLAEIKRVLKPGGVCAIWTAAPFWSPYRVGKNLGFLRMKKANGVFRLRKPETAELTERARD